MQAPGVRSIRSELFSFGFQLQDVLLLNSNFLVFDLGKVSLPKLSLNFNGDEARWVGFIRKVVSLDHLIGSWQGLFSHLKLVSILLGVEEVRVI